MKRGVLNKIQIKYLDGREGKQNLFENMYRKTWTVTDFTFHLPTILYFILQDVSPKKRKQSHLSTPNLQLSSNKFWGKIWIFWLKKIKSGQKTIYSVLQIMVNSYCKVDNTNYHLNSREFRIFLTSRCKKFSQQNWNYPSSYLNSTFYSYCRCNCCVVKNGLYKKDKF